MKSLRENCEYKDRCGAVGHYYDQKKRSWVRCACLNSEIDKIYLGQFYTPNVREDTPLLSMWDRDLLIEGDLVRIRSHVARVLLELRSRKLNYAAMDAYRLIEIFLDKDEEFKTASETVNFDLFIILLGFGDIANRRLPDCLLQVLNRRELLQKPTWVILGVDKSQISVRYNLELAQKLETFKRIKTR